MRESLRYYSWTPTIGDPTLVGWITVFAYFLTATLCLFYFRKLLKQNRSTEKWEAFFWLFVTIMMVFLGVNKQLDLQSLFTEFGRRISIEQGWYYKRRLYQKYFIVVLGIICISGISFLIYIFRNNLKKYGLALLGIVTTLSFIFIRAISFHHIDKFLRSQLIGVKMNWIFELTGIGIIALAAWLKLRVDLEQKLIE